RLFPVLSDQTTRQEKGSHFSLNPPSQEPWPLQREAAEVAWLLGAPFLIQVIEGSEGEVLHVLGGPVESSREGQRLLDARWHVEVDHPAELVVATITGNAERQGFAQLARAWACGARVVKPYDLFVFLIYAAGDLVRQFMVLLVSDV